MRILLLSATALLSGVMTAGPATAADDPAALASQLLALDTAVFDAFNACDTAKFASFLADDIEFYHDKQGLMTRKSLMEGFEPTCIQRLKGELPRVRRELVPGSMETWPIPGFGGIQSGSHRFYEQTAGKPDKLVGIGRFLHVWKQQGDRWKLERIVSYDHKAAP